MSSCWVRLLLDIFPLFSNSMALWISWYMMLSVMEKFCPIKKIRVQRMIDIVLLMPTSSASVELWVFSFCIRETTYGHPVPSDIVALYGNTCSGEQQMMRQPTNKWYQCCLWDALWMKDSANISPIFSNRLCLDTWHAWSRRRPQAAGQVAFVLTDKWCDDDRVWHQRHQACHSLDSHWTDDLQLVLHWSPSEVQLAFP
jgi:hypothetical protein